MSTEWLDEIERLKGLFPALSADVHRREIERRMIPAEPSAQADSEARPNKKGAPQSARKS